MFQQKMTAHIMPMHLVLAKTQIEVAAQAQKVELAMAQVIDLEATAQAQTISFPRA